MTYIRVRNDGNTMSNQLEQIHWVAIHDDILPMNEIKRITRVNVRDTYKLIVYTSNYKYEVDHGCTGFQALSALWHRVQNDFND